MGLVIHSSCRSNTHPFGTVGLGYEHQFQMVGPGFHYLAALALAKGIHLITVAPDAPTLTVRGHESELYRLLLNIFGNALEYIPQDGSVTIRLDTRDGRRGPVSDHRYALIEVKDTGFGIAPQDQAKIFDRFYRVNPDRARHTGGSGLRLAIASPSAQPQLRIF